MKKSVRTKSNDPSKILRMISRDEELERNDGKWVAMNRAYKNHKKYDKIMLLVKVFRGELEKL